MLFTELDAAQAEQIRGAATTIDIAANETAVWTYDTSTPNKNDGTWTVYKNYTKKNGGEVVGVYPSQKKSDYTFI